MAQFLGHNDFCVLNFIRQKPRKGRDLIRMFAAECDITHVVAGLKDRGLIRQLRCCQWSNHLYSISKDGKRQLNKQQKHTTHNNTRNVR